MPETSSSVRVFPRKGDFAASRSLYEESLASSHPPTPIAAGTTDDSGTVTFADLAVGRIAVSAAVPARAFGREDTAPSAYRRYERDHPRTVLTAKSMSGEVATYVSCMANSSSPSTVMGLLELIRTQVIVNSLGRRGATVTFPASLSGTILSVEKGEDGWVVKELPPALERFTDDFEP